MPRPVPGGRDASPALYLGQRGGLDGGADGDHLVGVDAIERWRPEELLDAPPYEGDACRSADENDLVEGAHRKPRDRERLLADGERSLDERHCEHLELVPGHPEIEIEMGASDPECDLAQLRMGALARREVYFGELASHP